MGKKIGRPTNELKDREIKIRVSTKTLEKLEYCHERMRLTKAEIVRKGIDRIYNELKYQEAFMESYKKD